MSSLSEVETQDTLPFVIDPTPQKPSNEPPKILAPSIEQVDEDPEVLRSLRGQGRYFGITSHNTEDLSHVVKEAEPKCNNCSQRGHLKKNCPHVICTYCGSMDDHYSQHCPKAIKCSNCNEKGHYRSQCPQKWKKVYCTLCDSNKHSRDRCPSIWRVYLLRDDINQNKKTEKGLSLNMDKIFCYNCGTDGHFGDDCNERRSSRVPNEDGSAFSGENLSQVLKNEYYDRIESNQYGYKSNRNTSFNNSYNNSNNNNNNQGHFDYNDYEYDDSMYDDYSNNSKSRKRFRNDKSNSYNNNNNNNYNGGYVQPTRRGNTLAPPSRNSYNNNNNNNGRQHPITFPRGSNSMSHNIDNARYGNASYNNNSGNSYNQNTKRYNPYKPFRSGTIKR